jgi:hypothetical protein
MTMFIEWNLICFGLYVTRLFFVSSIKLVNKQKEITKTVCDSVNHTRLLKEDHIPDCVYRDKHGNEGDRVEKFWANLYAESYSLLMDINEYTFLFSTVIVQFGWN